MRSTDFYKFPTPATRVDGVPKSGRLHNRSPDVHKNFDSLLDNFYFQLPNEK